MTSESTAIGSHYKPLDVPTVTVRLSTSSNATKTIPAMNAAIIELLQAPEAIDSSIGMQREVPRDKLRLVITIRFSEHSTRFVMLVAIQKEPNCNSGHIDLAILPWDLFKISHHCHCITIGSPVTLTADKMYRITRKQATANHAL